MKYPVFCVRDVKVGFDTRFLVEANEDAAKRGFSMAINTGGSMLNYQPSDYELYRLGDFDVESGRFIALDVPEFVVGGMDVYAKS